MKTFKTFLTSIAMLLCCVSVSAHDFEVNGICYNITSSTTKTVEVTYRGNDYDNWQDPSTKYSGSITIPQTVIYKGNNYNVTSIGERAFFYCSGLTNITISEGVTSIGSCAFNDCSELTSITIPNSVTSIGDEAFGICI